MNALALEDRSYTTTEYFALLATSRRKLEYTDGTVRLMAGGTAAHNDIIDNTFTALRAHQGDCKVKNSENAVAVTALNRYFFPDMTVTCGKPTYEDASIAMLTNPNLIVEVLSQQTADYDRSDKFAAYRHLESFREYILIDSRAMRVDTFYRESSELWHIRSYYSVEQAVEVRTLGVSVPMKVIYEDIAFADASDV